MGPPCQRKIPIILRNNQKQGQGLDAEEMFMEKHCILQSTKT
uniref:Uncharacterized protein n=1 Tax=Rhizophora mucronata TaxID=61149 RepID=A0A2P2JJG8_RHIMU